MTEHSRREFLETCSAAVVCVLVGCGTEAGRKTPKLGDNGVDCEVSRFMMKKDYPRLEVRSPHYRFVWHGRWFGFRLCGLPTEFDERISYVSFGSFQVGGVDLISTHNYVIPFKGQKAELNLGSGRLALPKKQDSQHPEFLLEYPGKARFYLRFSATPPHIQMTIEPLAGEAGAYYTVPIPGCGIFSQTWQGEKSAGYFAPGAQTGLCLAGDSAGDVRLHIDRHTTTTTLKCRVPSDRPSTWGFTVLGQTNWPINDEQSFSTVLQRMSEPSAFRTIEVNELASWEKQKMAENHWRAHRGAVQNRVAGIFVTAPKWNHPLSNDPCGQIEYVEKVFLDQVIATRAFPAIGLSRDGVYEQRKEFDTHAHWLKLVERIHAAGLLAYMKPGDGEIYRVRDSRATLAQWARDCFAVPPEQQADVLRLCWEAVLHPWDTADLCLPDLPKWIGKPDELPGLPWSRAHERIVTAVADRFSFLIDEVRRHSPRTKVDLECGDTAVFRTLLGRHENLGVMYMCYGPYPRVGEYLDLYCCVAREQLAAKRIVLETDCYYTYKHSTLGLLYRQSPEAMYGPADVENIAAKHRHMNQLAVQAAWAWGINVCYTREKFEAICRARGVLA